MRLDSYLSKKGVCFSLLGGGGGRSKKISAAGIHSKRTEKSFSRPLKGRCKRDSDDIEQKGVFRMGLRFGCEWKWTGGGDGFVKLLWSSEVARILWLHTM